jgi:membrane protein
MTFASPRDDATAASVDATPTPWWVVGAGALLLALGFGRKPLTVAPRSRERRRTGTLRDTRTRAREPRGREADDRGRSATTPSEIPARGWKDILVRTYGELGEDRVVAIAAGVTFYVLLAIFPAVAALVSLYGLFADP